MTPYSDMWYDTNIFEDNSTSIFIHDLYLHHHENLESTSHIVLKTIKEKYFTHILKRTFFLRYLDHNVEMVKLPDLRYHAVRLYKECNPFWLNMS